MLCLNWVVLMERIGPRKLFSKEEKVLLNMKIPDLATATSVSVLFSFVSSYRVNVLDSQLLFLWISVDYIYFVCMFITI